MNIEEYADVLNLELVIRRYPNQKNRYMAKFDDVETKKDAEDGCLTGTYGNGITAHEAVVDYVKQIHGRLLVVNATGGKDRRQYIVPAALEAW